MIQIQDIITKINLDLAELDFGIKPEPLTENYRQEILAAHRHPVIAGGKRIRPLLTLLMAGAIGGEKALSSANSSALAIELIHTYTLVHDDLPCMDNDDLRRGLPTTHKLFGEAKGLLVGDGLLAHAFLLASQTRWPHEAHYTKDIIEILANASSPGGVIWGQWLDLSFTAKEQTTWEQMEIVHKFKTGVLIAASLELGFICGISCLDIQLSFVLITKLREKIKSAGMYIGLAFQIIDDILDTTKTSKELGKTAGKDENQNKYTAVRLLGKEKAQQLSSQYTQYALNLIKEVFNSMEKTSDTHHFRILTIHQIETLLARIN